MRKSSSRIILHAFRILHRLNEAKGLAFREERGLTQLKVTAMLQIDGWDVSRQVLSFVEDGSRILSDKELFAILRVLGHEPAVLKCAFSEFCSERHKARKASRRISGG